MPIKAQRPMSPTGIHELTNAPTVAEDEQWSQHTPEVPEPSAIDHTSAFATSKPMTAAPTKLTTQQL